MGVPERPNQMEHGYESGTGTEADQSPPPSRHIAARVTLAMTLVLLTTVTTGAAIATVATAIP